MLAAVWLHDAVSVVAGGEHLGRVRPSMQVASAASDRPWVQCDLSIPLSLHWKMIKIYVSIPVSSFLIK